MAFPGETVRADELSVIAWVLPQAEHTRMAHRKAEAMPSIEWSKARHYGVKVNEKLRLHIVDLLLADGLITPAGKAVRVGSVIVRKRFAPTPRIYKTHNEWCLFHSGVKCLACMKRCPAGASSEAGHDKVKCKEYIRNVTAVHVEREQLGFRVNSCGLCQTKVPCEARNPLARKRR